MARRKKVLSPFSPRRSQMKQKILTLVFLVAFGVPFVGCTKAVKIVQPVKGDTHTPVPEFRVKLHANFDPTSFAATLDGMPHFYPFENITPGGTAVAPSAEFSPGKHRFRVTGDMSPSDAFASLSDEIEFTPPPLELSEPAWSS